MQAACGIIRKGNKGKALIFGEQVKTCVLVAAVLRKRKAQQAWYIAAAAFKLHIAGVKTLKGFVFACFRKHKVLQLGRQV